MRDRDETPYLDGSQIEPRNSLLAQTIGIGFALGPLLFGIGFLAPLIATLCNSFGISSPLGLLPIAFGLIIGAGLGLLAIIRKTWLW